MGKVQLECPNCRVAGKVDRQQLEEAGMKFRCPQCKKVFRIKKRESASPTGLDNGIQGSSQTIPGEEKKQSSQPIAPPSASKEEQVPAEAFPASAIVAPVGYKDDEEEAIGSLLFYGTGGSLFGIQLVNLLLSFVTLGFYRFWGKVKVRQYIYSQTELLGDRLVYLGTGKELLVGWLKAIGIIFVGFLFLRGLEFVHPAFIALSNFGILLLIGFAKIGSTRYRLSRTSLRGIRFSFQGTYKEGLALYVGGTILTGLTLGFYYPYFRTKMRNYWFNNSYYGDTPFRYTGQGKEIMGSYLLALPLTLLSLGLYWFWFTAKLDRYDWEHTTFPGLSFTSTVTGGAILGLQITNLLLLLFTFGLAFPWVIIRLLNFRFNHLVLSGQIEYEQIEQDLKAAQATGEGAADYMDMDFAFLDFGIF